MKKRTPEYNTLNEKITRLEETVGNLRYTLTQTQRELVEANNRTLLAQRETKEVRKINRAIRGIVLTYEDGGQYPLNFPGEY